MDVGLSTADQAVRESARDFARESLRPNATSIDEHDRLDVDLLRQLGELGYWGIAIPEADGGAGMDFITYTATLIELAQGCAASALSLALHHSLFCEPVSRFGTPEQKHRFLQPAVEGRAYGTMVPPSAGSSLKLTDSGDGLRLNGMYEGLLNGELSNFLLVCAQDETGRLNLVLLEKNAPGIELAPMEPFTGMRGIPRSKITFHDCKVSPTDLLGHPEKGYAIAAWTQNGAWLAIAATALGIGRVSLEEAIEYSRVRQQFKQPIVNFEVLRHFMADMAIKLDSLEAYLDQVARMRQSDLPHTREAAQIKVAATEAAYWVADKSLQIHGGYGYIREYTIERHFRDSRVLEVLFGNAEALRGVIANELLGWEVK